MTDETTTPTRAKRPSKAEATNDLASVIGAAINKEDNASIHAYSLGDEHAPTDLDDWCSTGADTLDVAISNREIGGFVFGRIHEITGLEGSGKSLLAAHIMANVQKAGGIAVLLDTESAVNEEFFNAVGVKLAKPNGMYIAVETVEAIFEAIEKIIEIVKKTGNGRKVCIVVDSVAGATTIDELESAHGKDGYNTGKSIIISKAMRKITNLVAREKVMLIFTNQLRHKMNAPAFSDPWTTSGGKAIAFHSSLRLRLSQLGMIKNKDGEIIGVKVGVKIPKNRYGPPHRKAEFDVYFDRGIDNTTALFQYLKQKDVIKTAGSWATYVDQYGEEHKFQAGTFGALMKKHNHLHPELYKKMCEAMVMSYSSEGITTESDDVTLDDQSQGEE